MPKTVIAFGETLWDLLPDGRKLGGAPFNFAYRVNCLGDRGLIVTRLGRDALGQEARGRIADLGMDIRFVQQDDARPTGTVEIRFTEGEPAPPTAKEGGWEPLPDYTIVPDVAYDHVEATPDLLAAAREADGVCFGTLSQRSPACRKALAKLLDACPKAVRVLDVNLRKECFTEATVRTCLSAANVLKCNDTETAVLSRLLGLAARDVPGFCRRVMPAFSLGHCVVTMGERGAYAASADGAEAYSPGYQVAVVDALGSGDAFTAGFVHRLLRGRPLGECLHLGNALGAMVARQPGATEPLSPEDVAAFLAADHERLAADGFQRTALE